MQANHLHPIHVGSDDSLALFSRGDRPKILQGHPTFIASKTANHFRDFVDCLAHRPSAVYIEKGFLTSEQRHEARELAKDIPVYFLSQYRFSRVFDKFKSYGETIVEMKYNWNVEQHHAQEWLYHIVSIDNYIKGTDNFLYVDDYGSFTLDGISQINIEKSHTRSTQIEIDTNVCSYVIKLGSTNSLIKGALVIEEIKNEDCLGLQINAILANNIEKLERL